MSKYIYLKTDKNYMMKGFQINPVEQIAEECP